MLLQQFVYPLGAKADEDVLVGEDEHGDAHLLGLLYHFHGGLAVRGDVVLGVGDVLRRKILFRFRAPGSSGRGIDDDVGICHEGSSIVIYFLILVFKGISSSKQYKTFFHE